MKTLSVCVTRSLHLLCFLISFVLNGTVGQSKLSLRHFSSSASAWAWNPASMFSLMTLSAIRFFSASDGILLVRSAGGDGIAGELRTKIGLSEPLKVVAT